MLYLGAMSVLGTDYVVSESEPPTLAYLSDSFEAVELSLSMYYVLASNSLYSLVQVPDHGR